MILGAGERLLSRTPDDAEWRRRARLTKEFALEPRGQSIPAVISLPMEMILGWIFAASKLLETARV